MLVLAPSDAAIGFLAHSDAEFVFGSAVPPLVWCRVRLGAHRVQGERYVSTRSVERWCDVTQVRLELRRGCSPLSLARDGLDSSTRRGRAGYRQHCCAGRKSVCRAAGIRKLVLHS